MASTTRESHDQRERDNARAMAELRERAQQENGLWIDEVVGNFAAGHPIPKTAIKGRWRLNANGELTGEFVPNPDFVERPPGRCPYRAPDR